MDESIGRMDERECGDETEKRDGIKAAMTAGRQRENKHDTKERRDGA